jgi:hypothetical protein
LPHSHDRVEDYLCQLLVASLREHKKAEKDSNTKEANHDQKQSEKTEAPPGFSDPLISLVRLPQLSSLLLVELVKVSSSFTCLSSLACNFPFRSRFRTATCPSMSVATRSCTELCKVRLLLDYFPCRALFLFLFCQTIPSLSLR